MACHPWPDCHQSKVGVDRQSCCRRSKVGVDCQSCCRRSKIVLRPPRVGGGRQWPRRLSPANPRKLAKNYNRQSLCRRCRWTLPTPPPMSRLCWWHLPRSDCQLNWCWHPRYCQHHQYCRRMTEQHPPWRCTQYRAELLSLFVKTSWCLKSSRLIRGSGLPTRNGLIVRLVPRRMPMAQAFLQLRAETRTESQAMRDTILELDGWKHRRTALRRRCRQRAAVAVNDGVIH